jgi:hypothetical protein
MLEVLRESVSLVNLPYTFLLGLVILYWLLYLLGVLGSEALDFAGFDVDADVDLDVDADADVDVDVDADVQAGGSGMAGLLSSMLHFLHIGEVPVIVVLSVLILSMWLLSLVTNHFLENSSALIALLLAIPIILVGLIVTKLAVMPFVPLLKGIFAEEGEKVEVIGKTCRITSLQATPKYGQAELVREGAPILLNVKTQEGVTLEKGAEAVVFDRDNASDAYLIAPFDIQTESSREDST